MVQNCPICGKEVDENARYPRYVCKDCAPRASDASGELVQFYQRFPDGQYAARYSDGRDYDSHDCFIDGVKCYADEARFGGIVVQAL